MGGASGRPRPTGVMVHGGRAAHMGPPLRLKRTALITRAVPHYPSRPAACHLPLKEGRGICLKAFPFKKVPPKGADEVSRMLNRACWLGQARRRCGTAPASIFHTARGPVARRELRPATQILRAGNILLSPRVTLVMGVLGGRAAWRREALPNRRLRPPPGAFW